MKRAHPLRESGHPFHRLFVVLERTTISRTKRSGHALVGDVVMRRSDTAARYDEVVRLGHPSNGLADLVLVICDDLDPFEFYAEIKQSLGHKITVAVFRFAWRSWK